MLSKYETFILLLFFTQAVLSQNQSLQGIELDNKVHVGYINDDPVFDDYREHKLYQLTDSLQFIKKYNDDETIWAVKDSLICSENKSGNKSILFVRNISNRIILEHHTNSKMSYVCMAPNGDCFFTDDKWKINWISKSGSVNVVAKGWAIDFDGRNLFHAVEHDKKIISANADIYQVNLNSRKKLKIANNLAGDGSFIFDNSKYLFDYKLIHGGYKPVIVNVSNRDLFFINKDEEFKDAQIFYFPKKQALACYYSSKKEIQLFFVHQIISSKTNRNHIVQ